MMLYADSEVKKVRRTCIHYPHTHQHTKLTIVNVKLKRSIAYRERVLLVNCFQRDQRNAAYSHITRHDRIKDDLNLAFMLLYFVWSIP